MASEPEILAFTGVITKSEEQFGMVRDDVFFNRSVVKGPFPKVGDLVLAQVEKVEGMPFKYVAKRVQGLYKSETSTSVNNLITPKVELRDSTETTFQESCQKESYKEIDSVPTSTTATLPNTDKHFVPLTAVQNPLPIKIECNSTEPCVNSEIHYIANTIPERSEKDSVLQGQKGQPESTVLQNMKIERRSETSVQNHHMNCDDVKNEKSSDMDDSRSSRQRRESQKCESKKGLSKRPSDFSKRLREKLSRLYCNEDGQEQCFTCGSTEHKVKHCPKRQEKILKKEPQESTKIIKEEVTEDPVDNKVSVSIASSSDIVNTETLVVKVEKEFVEYTNDAIHSEELEDPFLQDIEGSQNEKSQESETIDEDPNKNEKSKDFTKVRGSRILHPPPPPSLQSSSHVKEDSVSSKCQNEEIVKKDDESIKEKINENSLKKASPDSKKRSHEKGKKPEKDTKKPNLSSKSVKCSPKDSPTLKLGIICHNCKLVGHKVKNCPLVKPPTNKKAKATLLCKNCKRNNHKTEDCKFLKNPAFKKSKEGMFCRNCKRKNHNTENCRLLRFKEAEEIAFCINCQSASHNTENCQFLINPEFKNEQDVVFCINCQMANHNTEDCRFLKNPLYKVEETIFCHHCQKKNHRTEECRFLKSLTVTISKEVVFCHYCQKKNHKTEDCRSLKKESVQISEKDLPCKYCRMKNHTSENCLFHKISDVGKRGDGPKTCFKCLKTGHIGKNCRSKVPAPALQQSKSTCEGCVISMQGGSSLNHRKDCLFWKNPRFNGKRKHEENSQNPFNSNNQEVFDNNCNYPDPPMQMQHSAFHENQDEYSYERNMDERNFDFQGPPNKRRCQQMRHQNEDNYYQRNVDFQGPPIEEQHPMFNRNHDRYDYEDSFRGPPIGGRPPVFNPNSNKWSDEAPNDPVNESERKSPVRLVARMKEDIKSALIQNRKRLPPRNWRPHYSEPFDTPAGFNNCYQEPSNFSESFDTPQDFYHNDQSFQDDGSKTDYNQRSKKKPKCSHCKKKGHLDKECWFLHSMF